MRRFSGILSRSSLKLSFRSIRRHNKALADVLLSVQANGTGELKDNQDAKKKIGTNLLKVLVVSRKEHTL